MPASRDNFLLAKMTFVTSIGDFLTQFAIIKLVYSFYGNAFSAGFASVGIGSAATVVCGIGIPVLSRRIHTRSLLLFSQFGSAIVVAILLCLTTLFEIKAIWPLYLILFLQDSFGELFRAARETHSHGLSIATSNKRSLQAQLLSGFYGAQFIGPVLAFLLLRSFSPRIPIALDLLSFVATGFLCFGLKIGPELNEKLSIVRPINYLRERPLLRRLFLLRTVGFWIPTGICNVLIFVNIAARLKLGVEYSALCFAVLGLGGFFSSSVIQKTRWFNGADKRGNGSIAFVGHVGMAACTLGLVFSDTILLAGFVYLAHGVFMSLNAIATQTLRRELTSKSELPEVIALEGVVSFTVQFLVAMGVVNILGHIDNSLGIGLIFSSVVFLITAVMHLEFNKEVPAAESRV